MIALKLGSLLFSFPDGWTASQYDEWAFYRTQFCKLRDGIKAVDLLACDRDSTAWLIEVKDYRLNPRTKPSALGEEIAQKVFDTLAAMVPAAVNATKQVEQELARSFVRARKLRVVLHLEQPRTPSALRPKLIDPATLTQDLRRRLKPIDAHPLVVDSESDLLGWKVSAT